MSPSADSSTLHGQYYFEGEMLYLSESGEYRLSGLSVEEGEWYLDGNSLYLGSGIMKYQYMLVIISNGNYWLVFDADFEGQDGDEIFYGVSFKRYDSLWQALKVNLLGLISPNVS